MQLFAKIKYFIIVSFLILSSCSSVFDSLYINGSSNREPKFIVAVLLPLTGKYESLGDSLLKAINIGYYVAKNPYLSLKVYDTASSNELTIQATKQAIKDGAKIIIGPVVSNTTKVALQISESENIPLLTFSNDISVLKNTQNAYTLAYLPTSEIEFMIDFAIKNKNSKKFAILAPQSKYGELMVATAKESIKQRGLEEPIVISYPSNEVKLEQYLKNLVSNKQRQEYNSLNQKIQIGAQVLNASGMPLGEAPLPKLDFDTLLIADYGQRLNIVSSHLPFVDVNYQALTILGNTNWNDPTIFKDAILQNAYIPTYGDLEDTSFYRIYKKLYNVTPSLLEFVAYDSAKLVASLVYLDDEGHLVNNFTKEAIIHYSPKTFSLVPFAIREDGINSRNLQVAQIRNNRLVPIAIEIDYKDSIKIPSYQKLIIDKITDILPKD